MITTILLVIMCLVNYALCLYCMSEDQSPNMLFGSNTVYEAAKGKVETKLLQGCKVKGIWMLVRTGSHLPRKEEFKLWEKMKEMKEVVLSNHRIKARGTLCPRDLDALEAWYPTLDITKENILTNVGIAETSQIGKKMVEMFAEVFKNMTNPSTVMFAHSNQARAKQTAQVFLDGMRLAGSTARIVNLGEFSPLSIEQSCPKYNDFLSSPENLKESRMYKAQAEMRDLLRDVSYRLGYTYDLSYDVVHQIYKLCSYETAAHIETVSPWCAAFEKHHFKIFQNEEDIFTYYTNGFGSSFSPRLGCPTIKNFFQIFGEVAKNPQAEAQVTLLFGHADTLRCALTSLGISADANMLTARNADLGDERMWNSSKLIPYSANLQVVLYKCNSDYKVTFMLNNYKVIYSACNASYCDWNFLNEEFKDIVDPLSCNFDFCTQTLKSNSSRSLIIPIILIPFVFFWY